MNKIILPILMFMFVLQVASALTITGEVDFVPSLANTTYSHYGVSTGIEQITVDDDSINFNTYVKDVITLTATDHGSDNVYWNYDTSGKKLYINITHTGGVVELDGLLAIIDSTTGTYQVLKNGIIIDYYVGVPTYILTGVGNYTIKTYTTLSTLGDYSYDYDSNASETQRVSWNITITETIAEQFYDILLIDEYSNEYSTTYIDSGLNRVYTADFNIPTNPTVDTNVSFYWNFKKYIGGSIQSEHFNSSVTTIDIVDAHFGVACDVGYDNMWFFINIYDEDNPTVGLNTTSLLISEPKFEIDYWYGSDSGQTYITENYEMSPYAPASGFTYSWCVKIDRSDYTPNFSEFPYYGNLYGQFVLPAPQSLDGLEAPLSNIESTCDSTGVNCTSVSTTTYAYVNNTITQRVYFRNFWMAFPTNYIYLISDFTDYSPLEITLYDSLTGGKLENKYIYMQRYYVDTGTWRVVQTGKTDASGKTFFYIKEEDADYKFSFYDENGNIYETSPSMLFLCNAYICSRSFYIDITEATNTDRPVPNIELTYNNNTGIVESRWYVPDGESMTITTKVLKTSIGTSTLCEETTTGSSAIHYCDVSSHTGVATVIVTSTYEGVTKTELRTSFDLNIGKLSNVLDFQDSILWAVFFIITIVFASIITPVATVIATFVALLFLGLFGLISFPTSIFIISIGAIGTFIALKVRA